MKSFAHDIGRISSQSMTSRRILAFFYGLSRTTGRDCPVTVVIMGVLTPFTIKSTKSMIAMQKRFSGVERNSNRSTKVRKTASSSTKR